MSVSVTLLYILSGICLLLWGLRMVKRAVLLGYGAQVQKAISKGTKNRVLAMCSGVGVTLFLQSSTACALLTSSFVGRGLMTTGAGLAVMIGADIGTSFVAHLLSFRIEWVAPLLLSAGIIYHLMRDDGGSHRYVARLMIGLGFMLTALAVIRSSAAPLTESDVLPLILHPLENEPVLAILVAMFLTYIMHSSLSAVLLFATLTFSGVLSIHLALLFVIGANIGGAIIPLIAVIKDTPQAVQIPLGNLLMRIIVGIILLVFMPFALQYLEESGWDLSRQVIFSHMGFNVAIAVLFLPFVDTLAKICEKLSPAVEEDESLKDRPRYLDPKALSTPQAALSCATRETLHMAEVLEDMLKKSFKTLEKNDLALVQEIQQTDNVLDALFVATKDYIIRLSREELTAKETEKSLTIMAFATNLEHCGDIIEKSLMELAKKKIYQNDQFSDEGLAEIKSFQKRVLENLRLAQSIFLSSDEELAQQLLAGKKDLKLAENASSRSHMQRLRTGLPQSLATSELHMDVIRDYRRINTYISSVAYSILEDRDREKEKENA